MIFKYVLFDQAEAGRGHGLSEARKFARNNHGESTLNSQLRQGSTFVSASPVVVERAEL
jgi:signal transduction histidine kinase